MPWLEVVGIALGLAMDAFAVAAAAGVVVRRLTGRHVFRLAFHFGLFQFLMPVLGWLAGRTLAGYLRDYDHWVAFGLLAGVGGKMIWESFAPERPADASDPTRGWTLVVLSIATSLDALAVGITMAFLQVSIWGPSVVIGAVCAAITTIGILGGSRIGPRLGRWPEVAGGLVLLGIGARILILHLAGG
jgi:putative Mn2+ efflux pump MntP